MSTSPQVFDAVIKALVQRIGQPLTLDDAKAVAGILRDDAGRPVDLQRFTVERCGSLTFRAESFETIIRELRPLHGAHWRETEKHRHDIGLSTLCEGDVIADERHGRMVQFAARTDDGRLAGHYRMYLRHSRHTNTPFAQEDTVFLLPEFRVGRAGLRFVQYAEREIARVCGIREFRQDVKMSNPAAGRILAHLGYQPIATQFVKILPE